HAHRLQPLAEPVGRRTYPGAPDYGRVEPGTGRGVFDRDAEPSYHVGRAGMAGGRQVETLGAGDRRQPEGHAVRGAQLTREALVAEQVGAVGRDVHHEPGIGEWDRLEKRRARGRVGGQLEDSIMLLTEAELAGRAQHALADDPADGPRLDGEALGAWHAGAEP